MLDLIYECCYLLLDLTCWMMLMSIMIGVIAMVVLAVHYVAKFVQEETNG